MDADFVGTMCLYYLSVYIMNVKISEFVSGANLNTLTEHRNYIKFEWDALITFVWANHKLGIGAFNSNKNNSLCKLNKIYFLILHVKHVIQLISILIFYFCLLN